MFLLSHYITIEFQLYISKKENQTFFYVFFSAHTFTYTTDVSAVCNKCSSTKSLRPTQTQIFFFEVVSYNELFTCHAF